MDLEVLSLLYKATPSQGTPTVARSLSICHSLAGIDLWWSVAMRRHGNRIAIAVQVISSHISEASCYGWAIKVKCRVVQLCPRMEDFASDVDVCAAQTVYCRPWVEQ